MLPASREDRTLPPYTLPLTVTCGWLTPETALHPPALRLPTARLFTALMNPHDKREAMLSPAAEQITDTGETRRADNAVCWKKDQYPFVVAVIETQRARGYQRPVMQQGSRMQT